MLQWLADTFGAKWGSVMVYVIIVIEVLFVYNRVFRTHRPPLFKNILVYVSIFIGSSLLWLLQLLGLPIIEGLAVAILLMIIFRVRQYVRKISADQED